MNMGSAVRSQELDALQNDVASTDPGGAATCSTIATNPIIASTTAIQIPEASSANRSRISTRVRPRRSISALLRPGHDVLAMPKGRPAGTKRNEEFVDQRDEKRDGAERHHRLRNPERHRDDAVGNLVEAE